MTNTFFDMSKIRIVSSLLLIALAILAVGLIEPDFTSAQVRERSPEKFRKHANAIVNRYIVVLDDDAVNSITRDTAVAEIGNSFYGAPGYYTWRIYSYRGNGTYSFWLQQP